jgi:hypothetical protein
MTLFDLNIQRLTTMYDNITSWSSAAIPAAGENAAAIV